MLACTSGFKCFFNALITKFRLLAIAILPLAACATAPVQEMSDARQAVRAAELVGAEQRAPTSLAESRRLLREAQRHLRAGNYGSARELAVEARDHAINAREKAIQPIPAQLTPP